MAENGIRDALDRTVASLQRGVERLGVRAALPIIERWEGRLADSRNPELEEVSENLGILRILLSAKELDQIAVGELLTTLGEQVQRVANQDIDIEVADKLSQLSVLLSNEGDSLLGR